MSESFERGGRAWRRLLDRLRWRGARRTILQGPAAGLVIGTENSSADYAEGVNEPPVQQALVDLLEPAATFFDIGANAGFFSLLGARLVGEAGRVVAFEPVPAIAETAALNVRLNGFDNVEVLVVAVGAEPGHAPLRVTNHPGGATLTDDADASEVTDTIDTRVVSIDALVAESAVPVPDVVKIDVEGHESAVLRGMEQTLEAHSPTLLVELDAATTDLLEAKLRDITNQLAALGYRTRLLSTAYPDTAWKVLHFVAETG